MNSTITTTGTKALAAILTTADEIDYGTRYCPGKYPSERTNSGFVHLYYAPRTPRPKPRSTACGLFATLILLLCSLAQAGDTITTTEAAAIQWNDLDTKCGVTRQYARPIPGLLLFKDARGDQAVLIAETTEQSAGLPAVLSYSLNVDGVPITVGEHKRLLRSWWLLKGTPMYQTTNLLQPNTVVWGDAWRNVPPFGIEPVLKPGVANPTHDTGAAPKNGLRVGWGNEPVAGIESGRVLGHLPLCVRKPEAPFPFVMDAKLEFGPDWVGVLSYYRGQKDVNGNPLAQHTLDSNHAWEGLSAYLVAKGTVLERFYYDTCISLGISLVCHDYPGEVWRINPRGSGRKARAIIDAIGMARSNGDEDVAVWLEVYLTKWWDFYESKTSDIFTINSAKHLRPTNEYAITQYEYAPLMYALYLAEQHFKKPSAYLRAWLDWQRRFGKVPYWTYIAGADGKTWTIEQIIAHPLNAATVTGPGYYAEYGVFADLREAIGLERGEPARTDAKYMAAFSEANNAGYRLNLAMPPKFVVTINGKASDPVSSEEAQRLIVGAVWDGKSDFTVSIKVQ